MKLSERKGEEVLDIIADLIDPVCAIAEDAGELFEQHEVPDGMTSATFFLSRVRKALPGIIRKHKGELVTILSTVNGVSEEEYKANLTVPQLIKDAYDLLTDKDLIPFFGSSAEGGSPSN